MILLTVLGCITLRPLEPDAPCREVGFAISRRTFDCTGDEALANERYERFEDELRCVPVDYEGIDTDQSSQADWFGCSFAIGQLACPLVLEYGDDLQQWLTASEACELVVEPAS